MKGCTKCVMPETWAGITFDEEGVCNICREQSKNHELEGKSANILAWAIRGFKQ